MVGIIMDGIHYNVGVVYDSMVRKFELKSGPFAGEALSGRKIRDLLGTEYTYTMQIEPMPGDQASYDAFFHAISQPVDYHRITVPYGQSELTYDAAIESGEDTYGGVWCDENTWHGLSIEYVPMMPQRTE